MNKFFYILFAALLFSSCSPYQKALKSEDVAVKFDMATQMYEKQKYSKALKLIDQIAPAYRGKPQAEKLFYMYGKSLYAIKEYHSAGFQFESFVANYPKSEKVEEAAFLGAISYSMLSRVYSLEQSDTYIAIDKLQAFINNYPNSQYMAEANAKAKELREKIEKKNFEIAKQYNTISDFKSAIVALDNFILDFPGTPYKEQALFYKLDSAYQLAINSVPSKMEERLLVAKAAYNGFQKINPSAEYKGKADEMLARIENELKQFSK
jgi:outer membrane protein assembly factor BamD